MVYEDSINNLIFHLGNEVLKGKISLEQAFNEAKSANFQSRTEIKHHEEIIRFIGEIIDQDLDSALVFSYINLVCAEQKKKDLNPLLAYVHFLHGEVLRKKEWLDEATQHLIIARTYFNEMNMKAEVATCDQNMANIYLQLGQHNKALKHYQSAREICQERGMEGDVASFDMNIANLHKELGQHNTALEYYQSVREIFEKKGMEDGVAICDMRTASVYWELRQFSKALDPLKSARDIFEKKGMEGDVAICESNMANGYVELGQFSKALDPLKSARDIFEKKGMEDNVTSCDTTIARVFYELGQYDKALELYQSARESYLKKSMQNRVDKCDAGIANVYKKLGQYDKALELYQSAREMFEKEGMEDGVARCDANMAIVYKELGQYNKVLDHYHSAREIFEQSGFEDDVARCDMNLANVHRELGQYDKAFDLFTSAREMFEKEGMEDDVARCDANMGNLHEKLGQYDKAFDLFTSAREMFEKEGMEDDVARCDMNLANVHRELGQYDKALELYQSAREMFEKGKIEDSLAKCNFSIGSIYHELGMYDEAISLFQWVIDDYGYLLPLKWRSLHGLAIIYEKKDEIEKARNSFGQAIDAIENMWKDIPQEELRTSFLGSIYDVYHTTIDFCLAQNDFSGALEYIERAKSRNLAELLTYRDLMPKNATKDEINRYRELRFRLKACAMELNKERDRERASILQEKLSELDKKHDKMVIALRRKDPEFDPDFRNNLSYADITALASDSDTALIELFPMSDKTVVFVITGDDQLNESTEFILGYSSSNLENDIQGIIKLYNAYSKEENNQKKSEALIAWENKLDEILRGFCRKIFLRIEKHLKGKSKIIFIPYGGFHLLPLHAIPVEENGHKKYLIDKYTVIYAPSAKILKQCRERDRKNRNKVVVAFANPEGRDMLDFAYKEAKDLSELFDGSIYIDRAKRKDIINQGKGANIFHYAGHANFNSLLLHNEEGGKEDFRVDDIFMSLDFPNAYISTLSACETGMTQVGRVDEYVGLPSAFLYAGSASVISSLWSVNDASTSLLMRKMYEHIKDKRMGKAEALRKAQLWLKNPKKAEEHSKMLIEMQAQPVKIQWIGTEPPAPSSAPDFSKPFYWAGFICSGVD
jgi:CHAT domain-containing protein/tetratricopeptide (TPR) repeat protein